MHAGGCQLGKKKDEALWTLLAWRVVIVVILSRFRPFFEQGPRTANNRGKAKPSAIKGQGWCDARGASAGRCEQGGW